MTPTDKLLKMKKQIEQDKIQQAEIKGKTQSVKEQLKEISAYDSTKEARKVAEKLDITIMQNQKKLIEGIEQLEDEYETDNNE